MAYDAAVDHLPVYDDPAYNETAAVLWWLNRHGLILCRFNPTLRAFVPAITGFYFIVEAYHRERAGDD